MRKAVSILSICFLPLIFLVCISSCNRTAVQKPSETLLSKQVVEEILVEIYLIEGKMKVLIYNESAEKIRIQVNDEMKNLFKRYNTNYKQYTESYSYYMGDASVSKEMMSDVIDRLVFLQTEQVGNANPKDSLIVK